MATVAADPFLVELERFRGPLDLLLHLIRSQDLDIFDIPIACITGQFLAAIREIEHVELTRAGEFLEMAATLVRIKAQLLLPHRVEEEEEDPRADLVRRLLEYEHFSDAARLLAQAERERAMYLPKGFVAPREVPPVANTPLQTEWDDVWQAVLGLVERLGAPEPEVRLPGRVVRIDERIEHVVRALGERSRIEFVALIGPFGTRLHTVVTLLACLELARRHQLRIRQAGPFSALWILPAREA